MTGEDLPMNEGGAMENYRKIDYAHNKDVVLRYIPGHFITPSSHVSDFMDLIDMKSRQREARETAKEIAEQYYATTVVDTILCLENMEVVGAYLAEALTEAGVLSKNAHKTIYVARPEFNSAGQIIFRQNTLHMVMNKNVLLLAATVTTGSSLEHAINGIQYFGGKVIGVSSIFSAVREAGGMPVSALFTEKDLPEYASYSPAECPMCKARVPVDAICNGYGLSSL